MYSFHFNNFVGDLHIQAPKYYQDAPKDAILEPTSLNPVPKVSQTSSARASELQKTYEI
ncbi:MAG: hypothetical protein MK076_08940 [Flavobacteriales bacterium]|nr:hypothetical protein [Flavobacteriales bacterium]